MSSARRSLSWLLLGLPTSAVGGHPAKTSAQTFGSWCARHPRLLRGFVVLSLSWSVVYLVWRIGFSTNGAQPVLWAALLAAELYGLWNLATLAWMTWGVRPGQLGEAAWQLNDAAWQLNEPAGQLGGPAELDDTARQFVNAAEMRGDAAGGGLRGTLADGSLPSIDVYVCTYDESLHVLEATLAGCALLPQPHKTYVLDDGRRQEVARLAKQWGATWITRPHNANAKAGNINHALPLTNGELVLILDADHVPLPDALSTLCEPFSDPKVALVQSPHDFSNHDSVQHYGLGRHEQSLFFSVICAGKDRHGAAYWCGSGAVIRRKALLQIGGVATETIAEDFHTTIKLHNAGWRSRYLPYTVVQGLAPHDLASYLLQRDRWARGNLAVFTTPESPLRAKGLTKAQRLSYLASLTGYLAGPMRLLMLCILTIVLWSAALPLRVAPIALLTLWAPATLLTVLAGTALSRGVQSTAENCHFELCTAEIFTRALRCVARPGRAHFRVTPKEGIDRGGWQALRQFRVLLTIAGLLSLGIALRIATDLGTGVLPPIPGFAAWFVPALGLIELRRLTRTLLLVGRRRQLRCEYRTPLEGSAVVETSAGSGAPGSAAEVLAAAGASAVAAASTQDRRPARDAVPLLARMSDITVYGLGFEVATKLQEGTELRVTLRLPSLRGRATDPITIAAKVRSCRRTAGAWRIGATIVDCGASERRAIVEYSHVIWPYKRLRGEAPAALPAVEPALSGEAESRERISATAAGLLSIST